MEKLTLITGNESKASEFSRLLGRAVSHQKIDLPEVQSTDVTEVSKAKIAVAYQQLKTPVFVDDTGLTIHAWGELPGALIKFFLDNVGNEGILKMLAGEQDRSAHVTTSLGYQDNDRTIIAVGTVQGSIAPEPRGDNGFGYDAIFIPEGYDKTFAQMTDQEKDDVSMRALAAQDMLRQLNS